MWRVIHQSATDEFVRSVAARIRERRLELGLSKLAVAQAAGLDPRAITFVEENRRTPSVATVYRIALALDCEVGQLLPGRNDDRKAPPKSSS